jgi:hypothetical protein
MASKNEGIANIKSREHSQLVMMDPFTLNEFLAGQTSSNGGHPNLTFGDQTSFQNFA